MRQAWHTESMTGRTFQRRSSGDDESAPLSALDESAPLSAVDESAPLSAVDESAPLLAVDERALLPAGDEGASLLTKCMNRQIVKNRSRVINPATGS